MSAAENLKGIIVTCKTSKWEVLDRMDLPTEHSSPQHSVGYKVRRCSDGLIAFMKATDPDLTTDEDHSNLERFTAALLAHRFERMMLDHCKGSNMDRVVVALDHGDMLFNHDGIRTVVCFLIFEMATCDLRGRVNEANRFDLVWILGALHNLAVGLKQLHGGNVCHNDLKPANVLVFDAEIQKIADLGKATSPLHPAFHDLAVCAGDPQYAAPEILYSQEWRDDQPMKEASFDSRRAADLYQLGSVAFFMLHGRMLTPQILSLLVPAHLPPDEGRGWKGSYEEIIPYWRSAFGEAIADLQQGILRSFEPAQARIAAEIVSCVKQLCEPDLKHRGFPVAIGNSSDRFSVERYISQFDLLRGKALVGR